MFRYFERQFREKKCLQVDSEVGNYSIVYTMSVPHLINQLENYRWHRKLAQTVSKPGSKFDITRKGMLLRR